MIAPAGAVTRALLADGHDDLDEGAVAERLCRACVAGLAVDGAGLSLLTGTPSRVTVAATDPTARLLEDLQFTLNEGACVEAAVSGRPVLVPDLRDHSRTAGWPLFAAEVEARGGVAAVFALPLQWGAVNLGVLDLYRSTPGRLDDAQWRDAVAATDTAAVLMMGRRTDPARRGLIPEPAAGAAGSGEGVGGGWLEQVAGYRVEIYQAAGMVQVQLGLSGTDALARMRSYAFVEQLLLIDVARDVVDRRLVFTADMP